MRSRVPTPVRANRVWSYDNALDTTVSGQRIQCLTAVNEYTRECLAIDVTSAIRSKRVTEVRQKSSHSATAANSQRIADDLPMRTIHFFSSSMEKFHALSNRSTLQCACKPPSEVVTEWVDPSICR